MLQLAYTFTSNQNPHVPMKIVGVVRGESCMSCHVCTSPRDSGCQDRGYLSLLTSKATAVLGLLYATYSLLIIPSLTATE